MITGRPEAREYMTYSGAQHTQADERAPNLHRLRVSWLRAHLRYLCKPVCKCSD